MANKLRLTAYRVTAISIALLTPLAAHASGTHMMECSLMSHRTLPKDHPLTQDGLLYISPVKQQAPGVMEGDIIFQFANGRIIMKPHYPPVHEGNAPKANMILLLEESLRARVDCFGARSWPREPSVKGDWVEKNGIFGMPKKGLTK
jgi:hypothetical protein